MVRSEFGVNNESMDQSCLVSVVQAAAGGGVTVWGTFSWHILGITVPTEQCLNATACLSIAAFHVHPFMTTVLFYCVLTYGKRGGR